MKTNQGPTRRQPAQERAIQTVEVLLDATAVLLETHGYARLSTNKVAEKAGVSIGSLYQYFPNKEALLAALIARYQEEAWKEVAGMLAQHRGEPLENISRALIRHLLHRVERKRAFHQVLMEQVPREGRLARLLWFDDRLVELLSPYLEQHPQVRVRDVKLASFFIVQAVSHLLHLVVLHYPEIRANPEFEEELTRLTLSYLRSGLGVEA
jgi:AcrR family transcriptional regulator